MPFFPCRETLNVTNMHQVILVGNFDSTTFLRPILGIIGYVISLWNPAQAGGMYGVCSARPDSTLLRCGCNQTAKLEWLTESAAGAECN